MRHDTQHNDTQHDDTQHIDTQHKGLFYTLNINENQNHCAQCRDLFIVMLSVIMLSAIMLSVIMLRVIMLFVVAPKIWHKVSLHLRNKLNIKCNTKDIDECHYAMFCYTGCHIC